MKLNSILRAVGAHMIKTAMIAPPGGGTTPPAVKTPAQPQGASKLPQAAPNPMQQAQQKTNQMMSQVTSMKNPFTPPAPPKLAGLEAITKALPMIAEEAAGLYLRKGLQAGNTVASVPVAMDKVHKINDPTFTPDPTAARVKNILSLMSKLSGDVSAGGSAVADNQSGFFSPYVPSKLKNELQSPKARISSAFNLNGAGWKSTMAPEGDVAMSSFPKVAGPTDVEENRGGFQDQAAMMTNHLSDALAGGSMVVKDTVSQTFDRLRSFMKQDVTNMNMPNDNAAGGPEALASPSA